MLQNDIPGIYSIKLFEPKVVNEYCTRLKTLSTDEWKLASILTNKNGKIEPKPETNKRNAKILIENELCYDLKEIFRKKILTFITPYLPLEKNHHFCILEDFIVRYPEGGYYKLHTDTGKHPSSNPRYYSIVLYLNDDFDGGETEFPSLYYGVTPKAGHCIVFLSSYLHQAKTVTKGNKLVLIGWLGIKVDESSTD